MRTIRLLDEAYMDLRSGHLFYEKQATGLGGSFPNVKPGAISQPAPTFRRSRLPLIKTRARVQPGKKFPLSAAPRQFPAPPPNQSRNPAPAMPSAGVADFCLLFDGLQKVRRPSVREPTPVKPPKPPFPQRKFVNYSRAFPPKRARSQGRGRLDNGCGVCVPWVMIIRP